MRQSEEARVVLDVIQWQRSTFPDESLEAAIEHLAREVEELRANPRSGEEWADCMMLLLAVADRAGHDRAAELDRKHRINLSRRWCRQPDGSHEHR